MSRGNILCPDETDIMTKFQSGERICSVRKNVDWETDPIKPADARLVELDKQDMWECSLCHRSNLRDPTNQCHTPDCSGMTPLNDLLYRQKITLLPKLPAVDPITKIESVACPICPTKLAGGIECLVCKYRHPCVNFSTLMCECNHYKWTLPEASSGSSSSSSAMIAYNTGSVQEAMLVGDETSMEDGMSEGDGIRRPSQNAQADLCGYRNPAYRSMCENCGNSTDDSTLCMPDNDEFCEYLKLIGPVVTQYMVNVLRRAYKGRDAYLPMRNCSWKCLICEAVNESCFEDCKGCQYHPSARSEVYSSRPDLFKCPVCTDCHRYTCAFYCSRCLTAVKCLRCHTKAGGFCECNMRMSYILMDSPYNMYYEKYKSQFVDGVLVVPNEKLRICEELLESGKLELVAPSNETSTEPIFHPIRVECPDDMQSQTEGYSSFSDEMMLCKKMMTQYCEYDSDAEQFRIFTSFPPVHRNPLVGNYPVYFFLGESLKHAMEDPPSHVKLLIESGSFDRVLEKMIDYMSSCDFSYNNNVCFVSNFVTNALTFGDASAWTIVAGNNLLARAVAYRLVDAVHFYREVPRARILILDFIREIALKYQTDEFVMRIIFGLTMNCVTLCAARPMSGNIASSAVESSDPCWNLSWPLPARNRRELVSIGERIIESCKADRLSKFRVVKTFVKCAATNIPSPTNTLSHTHDPPCLLVLLAKSFCYFPDIWEYYLKVINGRGRSEVTAQPNEYFVSIYFGGLICQRNPAMLYSVEWDPMNNRVLSNAEQNIESCDVAVLTLSESFMRFVFFHQNETWPSTIVNGVGFTGHEPVYVSDHPWLERLPHRTLMGYAIQGLLKTAVDCWPVLNRTVCPDELEIFRRLDECRTAALRKLSSPSDYHADKRVDQYEYDLYFMQGNRILLCRQHEYMLISCILEDLALSEEHKLSILKQVIIDDLLQSNPPLQ